jgi:hypothetical protein
MSELQEQQFGLPAQEAKLGYSAMESVAPLPSDHSDVEVTSTELQDLAAEIQKDRDERLGAPSGETVREYKEADNPAKKLDEQLTVSAEQAAADLTAAREQEQKFLDLSDAKALAREIDALRGQSAPAYEQPQAQQQPLEQQQQITPEQFAQLPGDEQRRRAEAAHAEMQRQQNELQQTLQNNPALLAAVSEQVRQEQAKAAAAEQQYMAAIQANATAAIAHVVANFPEISGITEPAQLAGALHAVKQTNPGRAAEITEAIARTRQLVEENQRVQQYQAQQQQAQYQQYQAAKQAQFSRAAAVDDAAYDAWSRNQGVSRDEQQQITQEVMAEFRRQGWNDQQIAHAYNTNPAMRSLSGQIQMHQAAAYRLQQKKMANIRRTKLDRSPPHVQRPGSPLEIAREEDHQIRALNKGGGPLSPREAANLVIAQRARRR